MTPVMQSEVAEYLAARRALRAVDMAADGLLRLLGHSRNFVLVAEKV